MGKQRGFAEAVLYNPCDALMAFWLLIARGKYRSRSELVAVAAILHDWD